MNNNERVISSSQAINEALAIAGNRNKDILLFAEGVNDPAAVYGTHAGLIDIYGHERMIEMPIAENGLCGVAIGAAMHGKRPIIAFHRVEFALLALEQLFNNAAKMYYSSNGQHTSPIVIRLVIGRGWGQGPQHSQSLESLFACVPGLKVLMPVFPGDTKGMLLAAIEDNNPVVIIEHRWCHYVKGHVDEGYYIENIQRPKKIRSGDNLTIVSSSFSTLEAIKACDVLKKIDVDVDLFDLRVLNPLDLEEISESFKITGRLMTVDTGHKTHGIGGEILAQILETSGEFIKCPPKRIGLPDHPVPSSRGYIPGLYPDARKIVEGVCDMLEVSLENKLSCMDQLTKSSNDLPVDIPDPSFTGPF